ncbi:MAG: hypothetical protein JNL67_07745 [Planctomycetaceae bacterium]|nr:hypothetical protein [Planctomycetaceae bacterium]
MNTPPNLKLFISATSLAQYPLDQPNQSMRHALSSVNVADLFPEPVGTNSHVQCVLSGLWLLHGYLDEAHEICQAVPTAEGSFWHAIMHRMEQDYWNSKYWYQKIGQHAVLDRIAARLQKRWQPGHFVDECEKFRGTGARVAQASDIRRLSQIEWQELFQYCWEQACGQSFPSHLLEK